MTEEPEEESVVHRRYRLRLDPNQSQLQVLGQLVGAARVAFNMMCAYNLKIDQSRQERHKELTDAGLDSGAAWKQVDREAKTNSSLKILGSRQFDTEKFTSERDRHRKAAADIAAGADPATVWDPEKEGYAAPWLHTVTRRVMVSGFNNCGAAFSNWIKSRSGKRQGPKMGQPKFKKKYRSGESFTIPVPEAMGPKGFASYKRGEERSGEIADYRHVRLSHLGTFRTFDSTKRLVRALRRGGVLKSYTVSRKANWWYVSFLVAHPAPQDPPQPTRRQREAGAVGLDFGVSQLITLSTGGGIANPRHRARAEKKIKRVKRKLDRAQKGSNRRKKLAQRLARHEHTVALQRRGFLNELTTALADSFAAIGIEDLNVAGMTSSARGTVDHPGSNVKQKAGLNRAILDASPGEFRRQLNYKCTERGVALVAIDQFFPSSQICSECGSKTKMPLAKRDYDCQQCEMLLDRDINAAINILREATRLAQANHEDSSAPEGADIKWPWSPQHTGPGGGQGWSLGHGSGKAHVVTAVEQSTARPLEPAGSQ